MEDGFKKACLPLFSMFTLLPLLYGPWGEGPWGEGARGLGGGGKGPGGAHACMTGRAILPGFLGKHKQNYVYNLYTTDTEQVSKGNTP